MEISSDLTWKIQASHRVIKGAFKKFDNLALAWTSGKDSTVVLHMIKKLNQGKIPIPVMFIDSSREFEEIYTFVSRLEKKWKLNLIRVTDKETLKKFHQTKNLAKRKELARILKIKAIQNTIKKYHWKALIAGIRWDEHEARSQEKYFSKRKDHLRVHPILHFTEADIWDYIKKFKVPYNPLYDQGYRSLGEKDFTKPVTDKKQPERAGREKEKEQIMKRLRTLGYF